MVFGMTRSISVSGVDWVLLVTTAINVVSLVGCCVHFCREQISATTIRNP
jgi:hypothetical protein